MPLMNLFVLVLFGRCAGCALGRGCCLVLVVALKRVLWDGVHPDTHGGRWPVGPVGQTRIACRAAVGKVSTLKRSVY